VVRKPDTAQLDQLWIKASVTGGLWAAVEIILGSFLHNLKFPFAGTVLTAIGIIFLISFYQIWPEKGLIWRAGLVCALMKSISPSAVILGPMIGIFTEALLIDLTIRIGGNWLFSYAVGGALAMISTLLHKVISLLIYYGFNLIQIYENIYSFALRQLHLPESSPWNLLLIFLVIYLIAGIISSLIGYTIGRKSRQMEVSRPLAVQFSNPGKELFTLPEQQKFSLPLFFIHLLSVLAGMFLLNRMNFFIALGFVLIYTCFTLIYYRTMIQRFRKPFFWIQIFLMVIVAGLFWENLSSSDKAFSIAGIWVGIEMCLRAILIFVGFSSISIEIRNPIIKAFLIRKGFRKIYLSVSMAFAALPLMIERISNPFHFLIRPGKSISLIANDAHSWFSVFEAEKMESRTNAADQE
jgi:hypothetical protein